MGATLAAMAVARPVFVRLHSGLGNQLFQLAAVPIFKRRPIGENLYPLEARLRGSFEPSRREPVRAGEISRETKDHLVAGNLSIAAAIPGPVHPAFGADHNAVHCGDAFDRFNCMAPLFQ